MSVVDLHPEELFDKLAQGRLSNTENDRLQAHLATCAACRFELDVRRDCAEIPADLVAAAPIIIPDGTAARHPVEVEPRVSTTRRGRRPIWGLAVAAALIGGASFAAVNPNVREAVRHLSFATKGSGDAVRSPNGLRVPPPAPALEKAVAPPTETEPKPTVQLDELPRAAPTPAPGASATTTPAALFHAANEARRAGDDSRAIALYHALEGQFPNSEEARLSHATLGRLMLDRGDAKMALDDFDKYLSHGGALGEEALVGRALALGKLGNRAEEAAAWQEVLRRFPKSIHARLARTRLASLDEQ
jgi:TolA-binding protein